MKATRLWSKWGARSCWANKLLGQKVYDITCACSIEQRYPIHMLFMATDLWPKTKPSRVEFQGPVTIWFDLLDDMRAEDIPPELKGTGAINFRDFCLTRLGVDSKELNEFIQTNR